MVSNVRGWDREGVCSDVSPDVRHVVCSRLKHTPFTLFCFLEEFERIFQLRVFMVGGKWMWTEVNLNKNIKRNQEKSWTVVCLLAAGLVLMVNKHRCSISWWFLLLWSNSGWGHPWERSVPGVLWRLHHKASLCSAPLTNTWQSEFIGRRPIRALLLGRASAALGQSAQRNGTRASELCCDVVTWRWEKECQHGSVARTRHECATTITRRGGDERVKIETAIDGAASYTDPPSVWTR